MFGWDLTLDEARADRVDNVIARRKGASAQRREALGLFDRVGDHRE